MCKQEQIKATFQIQTDYTDQTDSIRKIYSNIIQIENHCPRVAT